MRRGSLVGPFILIGIGVVLLINNLHPDLSLLELASQYWPFLLIIWGGLRLVEILITAARSQPLPWAGITGGEWALIVLIALVGSGTRFAQDNWPNARITMHGLEFFGEAYDFPVAGSQAAGESPRVFIENLRGNVRVVGGDNAEVKVEGRTTIRAFDKESAEETSGKCPLEIVRQGDRIIVRTNHDRVSGTSKLSTDLDVTVPAGASVEGSGRYGDFDISNVSGDVDIKSDNAGVRLTAIGGSARVELRRSDIIRITNLKGAAVLKGRGQDVEIEGIEGLVTIDGSYSGELTMRKLAQPLVFKSKRTEFRVEQTPGQIRMALGDLTAENLVGPILLKTSSRDVSISGFTNNLRLEIDRGDIELRPGTAAIDEIDVELRSGNIMLTAPESADFGVNASTESGETVNEYGPALSAERVGERGAKLTGPEGKTPNVKLKTKRGDIVVRQGGASGGAEPKRLESTSA